MCKLTALRATTAGASNNRNAIVNTSVASASASPEAQHATGRCVASPEPSIVSTVSMSRRKSSPFRRHAHVEAQQIGVDSAAKQLNARLLLLAVWPAA